MIAENEKGHAEVLRGNPMLISHHPEQMLACRRRDVMQNRLYIRPGPQKDDGVMAMGAVRMEKHMKTPVVLPIQRAGRLRCRRAQLEERKYRDQCQARKIRNRPGVAAATYLLILPRILRWRPLAVL